MHITPFKLERYFAKYEFTTKYLLSSSDCDGLAQTELLSWADEETRVLWRELKLGYTESRGHPLLRKEIASLYKSIAPDDVLVAVPEEGILLALTAILEQHDHVVCTWPGYQSLYQIAELIGCEVTKWEPVEGDRWLFDVDTLETLVRPDTKLLIVNFPHNPTGSMPTQEEFRRILRIAERHGCYVFSDEMYRFLEYDSASHLPSACDMYEKAISLFGMSKTFGLAGLRIGWLATKDADLPRKMMLVKDYTTIDSSAPSEILTLIGLRARDRIIQRHLSRVRGNLELLDGFFDRRSRLFRWARPVAGTIAFPRILFGATASGFCERLVQHAGIMLLPSTVYGYGDAHFRMGFGRANLPEVLERFERYLEVSDL
jgi:aspartate/methionine/tyrosine aminotransferase